MAKLFPSLNESKKSQILRSNQPSDPDNEFRTNPHSYMNIQRKYEQNFHQH